MPASLFALARGVITARIPETVQNNSMNHVSIHVCAPVVFPDSKISRRGKWRVITSDDKRCFMW